MASGEAIGALQDLMQSLRQRPVQNPSCRDPTMSRDHNDADRIEAQIQSSKHRTWGFVIYRTTYADDAQWQKCLLQLRKWTEKSLDADSGRDIFDLMTWTVFDDQAQFDRAPTAFIRQHFKQWSGLAVRAEQDGLDGNGNDNTGLGWSPRYRYCIQIDHESLDSILVSLDQSAINRGHQGWVKLIEKDWLPVRENLIYATPDREIDDTVFEPIEGVIEEHVGWVRCPVDHVTVSYYVQCQDRNGYGGLEERPPAIIS